MKKHLILTLALTISAALSATAAEEKKGEKHEHKGEKHKHAEVKVNVKIPETAEALWSEIETKQKALSAAVAGKKAEGIHELAETVEALVAAVPAKHADLAADKKKRVEGMSKNVGRVLDELHEEAEEGHWDDAAKKLKQADAAIIIIKGQVAK